MNAMMSLQDVRPIIEANGFEHAGEGDGRAQEGPESALRGQADVGLRNIVVSRTPARSSATCSRPNSTGALRPRCATLRKRDRSARRGVPDAASQIGDVVDIIERTQQSERRS
jgi:hypothetical protein